MKEELKPLKFISPKMIEEAKFNVPIMQVKFESKKERKNIKLNNKTK